MTPGSSALLLVYQSSHAGMTETGEKTALPQSTTKTESVIRFVTSALIYLQNEL